MGVWVWVWVWVWVCGCVGVDVCYDRETVELELLVLALYLFMCPHTSINLSSYLSTCDPIRLCVLIPLCIFVLYPCGASPRIKLLYASRVAPLDVMG